MNIAVLLASKQARDGSRLCATRATKRKRCRMSFETKAKIELVSMVICMVILFTLPIVLMGVGI